METLTKKANSEVMQDNEKFVVERCGYCKEDRKIPKDLYEEICKARLGKGDKSALKRKYPSINGSDPVYVYEGWGFYCNQNCYNNSCQD